MTGLLATALTGFFLLPNGSAALALASSATEEAPQVPTYETQVTLTAYNAVESQTDADPTTTASGAFSDPDVVAARSGDLAGELPFGTVIEIVPVADSTDPNCGIGLVSERIGYRVIADAMHPRKRDQVDILLPADKDVRVGGKMVNPAIALGMCKDVTIRVVGHVDIAHMPKTQAQLVKAIGKDTLAVRD